jgi:MFS family permease
MLVPLSVGTFVSSRLTPSFTRRFGTRTMIPVGSLIFAGSSLFFAAQHTSLWQACVAVGLVGIGLGFTFAAMPGFIVRAVPANETGSATGFYQVLRSVGLSVGSACSAAVLTAFTPHGASIPTIHGFTTALYIAAGLCLLTAVVSYLLPGKGDVLAPRGPLAQHQLDELGEENAEVAGSGAMLAEEPLLLEDEPIEA